jgi:hypothetical protein
LKATIAPIRFSPGQLKPMPTANRYWSLLVEGLAIIASILLAFAIDAWWDNRQFEQDVAEDLVILESELTENMRLAQVQIDMMTRIVAATQALVDALQSQPELELIEVSDSTLYWSVFINPTFDPSLGGIDAWIAAGRMRGIDSPLLRQQLAGIRGLVDDTVEEQLVARQIGVSELYPLIKDGIGDISPVIKLFTDGFHLRQRTTVESLPESGSIPVPNSGALRFLLQARTVWYEASIKELGAFQATLEEIRQALRKEIGHDAAETP